MNVLKRAIITGATGAIGVAIVRELVKHNVEVLVLCREGSVRNVHIPEHPLVEKRNCSLDKLCFLENSTEKQYDVFYHLAWDGTVGNARNDLYMQNTNVRYSLDAVNVAKRFGCHTFVGVGSQAEYGRFEGVLTPGTSTFPENGYGIAKLCAGHMTRELAHQNNMKHIWVRVLSVYGAYDGPQSMVMGAINQLSRGEVPKFTKGEQQWDYLYSEDAAEAFFLLGESGVDGKIYVLGSGNVRPLKVYIDDIREIVSPNGRVEMGAVPYAPKQVMYLCADTSDLLKDVGWKSRTSFREGIRKIIDEGIH